MKTLKLVLGTFLACTMFAFASGKVDRVPQKVQAAFAKKFPTVKKVKWDKESANEWEAEFRFNKTEYSANFTSDGTWKETEYAIDKKEIPANIKAALSQKFKGYKIDEADISETMNGKVYEFDIEKGNIKKEVAIDFSGRVVKQEVINDEDND